MNYSITRKSSCVKARGIPPRWVASARYAALSNGGGGGGGLPYPVLGWDGVPPPHPDLGWGTPPSPLSRPGMGYPPPFRPGMG